MGIMDRLEHGFSSLFGNVLSLGTGHGIDQSESYYQPEGSQKTDIHINADAIELKAQNVNVESEHAAAEQMQVADAAAMQQATATVAPSSEKMTAKEMINGHDWSVENTPEPAAPHELREAVFNRAMREQEDGLTLSR